MKKTNVVITAGPTREYIDPIRFISNASSGRTGYSIAAAAAAGGAQTTIVSGPVNILPPKSQKIRLINIETNAQMLAETKQLSKNADIVIFCAAVCDFKPAAFQRHKIKKHDNKTLLLKFSPAVNILKTVTALHKDSRKVFVGFALETKNLLRNALKKIHVSHLDLIVANPHTSIGSASSRGYFIYKSGKAEKIPPISKEKFARAVWEKARSLHEQKKRVS